LVINRAAKLSLIDSSMKKAAVPSILVGVVLLTVALFQVFFC
jgi:hypothetical protein